MQLVLFHRNRFFLGGEKTHHEKRFIESMALPAGMRKDPEAIGSVGSSGWRFFCGKQSDRTPGRIG